MLLDGSFVRADAKDAFAFTNPVRVCSVRLCNPEAMLLDADPGFTAPKACVVQALAINTTSVKVVFIPLNSMGGRESMIEFIRIILGFS
jgi:hypothetical protein